MANEFPGGAATGRAESVTALKNTRCFVKSKCGAVVRGGPTFASALLAELPHRCVVTAVAVAENANGARVQIIAPLEGIT